MRRRGLIAAASALAFRGRASAFAQPIAVGVTPGLHAEIMQVVGEVAARSGLALRLVERAAGHAINADVAAGRLDAACFQDAVAFAAEMRRHGDALVNVGRTVTLPMAIYSRRLGSLRALRPGDAVALPHAAADVSRALILLQNYGLVTLRDGSGLQATLADVTSNRLRLRWSSWQPDRLPSVLVDCACAVVDSPHALRVGWLPGRDAIGVEDARTPYADIVAVRRADGGAPWVAALLSAYHSEAIKHLLFERYADSVRRPW